MVALRCKFCGAPLESEQLESDSPYVTCAYCGTSQQRIDAKKYMDDVMAQVKSWISKAMPLGLSGAGIENVDPVARHSIFNKDIKPSIEAELASYKFSNMALLGNNLLTMPFKTTSAINLDHTSNMAFEFTAKVKSVAPLAMSAEDKKLVTDASVLAQSYALAINNVRLLNEEKDGRWGIMAGNFREASKTYSSLDGYALPTQRFEALATICDGFEQMMNGDIASAYGNVNRGCEMLISLKDKIFTDPQFSIMYSAVDQEINLTKILREMLDVINNSGENPVAMMDILRKVVDMPVPSNVTWGYLLNSPGRFNEILENIFLAMKAKNGGTLPIAAGDGKVLMPFWEIDLRYTFVTGKLWAKKSVEVKEDLLLCADFVTDPVCLTNPASSMTDIFKIRPQSSIIDSWKGNETSISGGEGIGKIQDSVSEKPVSGRNILLPLSTKREAEKMCAEYLSQRTRSDDKFRLSKPIVNRLIYVPCDSENGQIYLPEDFGSLRPDHLSNIGPNNNFII